MSNKRVAEVRPGLIPISSYFLAPALNDEPGYLCKGEWYWVLGKSQSDTGKVRWVSSDFVVYCNPITDFDLTAQQLQDLNKDNEV